MRVVHFCRDCGKLVEDGWVACPACGGAQVTQEVKVQDSAVTGGIHQTTNITQNTTAASTSCPLCNSSRITIEGCSSCESPAHCQVCKDDVNKKKRRIWSEYNPANSKFKRHCMSCFTSESESFVEHTRNIKSMIQDIKDDLDFLLNLFSERRQISASSASDWAGEYTSLDTLEKFMNMPTWKITEDDIDGEDLDKFFGNMLLDACRDEFVLQGTILGVDGYDLNRNDKPFFIRRTWSSEDWLIPILPPYTTQDGRTKRFQCIPPSLFWWCRPSGCSIEAGGRDTFQREKFVKLMTKCSDSWGEMKRPEYWNLTSYLERSEIHDNPFVAYSSLILRRAPGGDESNIELRTQWRLYQTLTPDIPEEISTILQGSVWRLVEFESLMEGCKNPEYLQLLAKEMEEVPTQEDLAEWESDLALS